MSPFLRMAFFLLAFVVGCGSSTIPPQTVPLPIPTFPMPLVREMYIPARRSHAPVPLVVIIDDGPPVDVSLSRHAAKTLDQLVAMIRREGYAVWRPLRDAWPRDSLLIRCPDELVAQVRVGLLAAKEFPAIDSSRIVLLGFGQGGVIGAMLARRAGHLVRALGLVGTPARSVDRIIASPALRDSVTLRRLRRIFDALWRGAYSDTQTVFHGKVACWRAWLVVTDRMPELVASLPQPVLAVQGTADSLLPLLDIERFRRAIRGRPHSAAYNALGVRHDLRDQLPDPGQNAEAVSPRLAGPIVRWLKEVAPPPAASARP